MRSFATSGGWDKSGGNRRGGWNIQPSPWQRVMNRSFGVAILSRVSGRSDVLGPCAFLQNKDSNQCKGQEQRGAGAMSDDALQAGELSPSDQVRQVASTTEADPNVDVGIEKIAGVYAEAFLEAVVRACDAADVASQVEPFVEELEQIVSDVLNAYPQYEQLLDSALITEEEKCELLDRTFRSSASPMVLHFLKVLARHGRLDCFRAVAKEVRVLYEKSLGRVRVTVTTSVPLANDLAQRLSDGIAPIAGGTPILETVVDPELIGGIVIRVGDTVYDASIVTQLKNLREQLVLRSTHEIQGRRDRFRNPE